MNSKQFGKLLIVLLVLGLAGFLFRQSRQSDWKDTASGGGSKLLGDLDINSIAAVSIKDSDGELDLAKSDGKWIVKQRGGYPAKYSSVVDFVWKLSEIDVLQKQAIGESAFARMEVNKPGSDEGAGTLLELKDDGGNTLKSFILGKDVMKKGEANSMFGGNDFAVGRWLLDTADEKNILSVSETLSDADSGAKEWLKSDFFKITKLKSIQVTHSSTNSYSWTVNREKENGDWKLAGLEDGEEGESGKLSAIGNPLGSPNFQDVVVEAKDEDLGFDKPINIQLKTFEGFTYDLTVGKQNEDNDYPIRVKVSAKLNEKRVPGKDEKDEDKEKLDQDFADNLKKLKEKIEIEEAFGKWTYTVSKWTMDSLIKERKDFIAEKEEESEVSEIPDTPTPLINPTPPQAMKKPEAKETKPVKKSVKQPTPEEVDVPKVEEGKKPESKDEAKLETKPKKAKKAAKSTSKQPLTEKKATASSPEKKDAEEDASSEKKPDSK